jgi:hypothetical protein
MFTNFFINLWEKILQAGFAGYLSWLVVLNKKNYRLTNIISGLGTCFIPYGTILYIPPRYNLTYNLTESLVGDI